jgi:hypothetical protein
MKIYLCGTANLGDFLNAMPVLSGVTKAYVKYTLVIKSEMRKFKGIREFLNYQDLFEEVVFDDEVVTYNEGIIQLSSWPMREDKNDINRPIETCRYENWLKDYYNLKFLVDDNFTLKVEELNLPIDDSYYGGDRWSGHNIDKRRSSWTLAQLPGIKFLDYDDDLMTNAYIIKHCKEPFISTFTGISCIADLLNKKQIVLWSDDIRNWDNKPIEYSFDKHYYRNRNSILMYINDFNVEKVNEYYRV